MHTISRLILPSLLLFSTMPINAATVDADTAAFYSTTEDYYNNTNTNMSANNASLEASKKVLEEIKKDLDSLGGYLGYDITQAITTAVSQQLIGPAAMQLAQNYVYITMLGATPVTAINTETSRLVPTSSEYSFINQFVNASFPSYNSPNAQATASANPLIDQQNFQPDPVSQAVLNILGTPDYTYCMSNTSAKDWNYNCGYLSEYTVMSNVVGRLPSPQEFFSYAYNQQYISQLNSNTLLAPMLYSAPASNSGSSGNSQGLTATMDNQVQQAANFIRYATGAVAPIPLPKWSDYDSLYTAAIKQLGTDEIPATPAEIITQKKAQGIISNYLASLRVYAAQRSVAISNFYYIMSKRLPQNPAGNQGSPTSQALSEFTMASWRLFKPDSDPNNKSPQWLNQINTASPATVQKEIATLLAEINYQLYLSRQQEERLLLTNSMLLLQSMNLGKPSLSSVKERSMQ